MTVRVYPLDDGTFVIADGGGWLPGLYASEEAARAAAAQGYGKCHALSSISRVDGEDRPITSDDVDSHA
jgi:hypothetical protein